MYWDQWSPAAHCLHEGLPSLAALVTKTNLFGYIPVLYGYDFEPDALGTIRIFFQGEVRILMAPFEKLLSGLPAKLRKDFADGLAAAKVEAVAQLQRPRT